MFLSIQITLTSRVTKLTRSTQLFDVIDCNVFQCIVITVGGRFFSTDSRHDIVIFKDFNSLGETLLSLPLTNWQLDRKI